LTRAAVAVGVVLALFVFLCRFRRVHTTVDDAVLDAIQRLSKAAPELRSVQLQDQERCNI